MITVLVSPDDLSGDTLQIQGDAYRHLFRSRRLPEGVTLRLVDGAGAARWGEVSHVGPKHAEVKVGAVAPAREPAREVRLLVAAPRFQRASWLVEKATELGVAEIYFLGSERSPRSYGEGNLERLHRVAVGALQQCHGSRLPKISGIRPFEEIPDLIQTTDFLVFFDLDAETEAGNDLDADPYSKRAKGSMICLHGISLAVGPEGGWTPEERRRLLEWGFSPRCLGDRVLRVETAAIVGASGALGLLGSASFPCICDEASGV